MPVENAGQEVVDHDVGVREQPLDVATAGLLAQVSGQTELISINTEVVRAATLAVEWRSPGPRPSSMVQSGPASTRVRSRTLSPESITVA